MSGGSDTSKVNYKLAGSGDENTTYDNADAKTCWKFFELSDTDAATEPMGVVVEDYSGKLSGDYTDTVTFTVAVKTKATMKFARDQFSANEGQGTVQCFKMTGDGKVDFYPENASIADITKMGSDYNLTYKKQGSTTITAKVEDTEEYAYVENIEPHNVREYIGGHFVRRAADGSNEIVTLVDASTETREVGCYSLQTAYNENFMAENMLSITMEYVPGRYHYFDIGDNMVYDPDSMARDIAKYGLFTAEEFSDYLAPELFDMFNGAYFKVLVGRGTLTYEDIFRMIEISPIE